MRGCRRKNFIYTTTAGKCIYLFLLFAPRLASLCGAGVVSNHMTESQSHRVVAVVHSHHHHLLVRGTLWQAGLVYNGLWETRKTKIIFSVKIWLMSLTSLVALERQCQNIRYTPIIKYFEVELKSTVKEKKRELHVWKKHITWALSHTLNLDIYVKCHR